MININPISQNAFQRPRNLLDACQLLIDVYWLATLSAARSTCIIMEYMYYMDYLAVHTSLLLFPNKLLLYPTYTSRKENLIFPSQKY